jgi:hypothetical protein
MELLPPNSDRVALEMTAHGMTGAVLSVYVTEQGGERETFALMNGTVPDGVLTVAGWPITPVSVHSPIGRRLQEASVAELVMVRTSEGEYALEIISINGSPIVSPQERLRLRKLREEARKTAFAVRWAAEQEAHRRRLEQHAEQNTVDDLKRRRQERDRLWREQVGRQGR